MNTSEADSEQELRGMRNDVGLFEKSAAPLDLSIIVIRVSAIANELKKPLETLLLCLAWLLEKQTGIDLKDALFLVDIMRWSITQHVRIINDLFGTSLTRMGDLRLDLVELEFDAIVRLMDSEFEIIAFDRELRFNIDESTCRLCIDDPFRLEQMLWNLFDKAVAQ